MSQITCFEDIMNIYNVSIDHLKILDVYAKQFLKEKKGLTIYLKTKDELFYLGNQLYKVNRRLEEKQIEPIDTCKANNTEIFLEKDESKIGGLCGRLFDLIHISGHISQWEDDPLSYPFGIQDHMGDPTKKSEVIEYEMTAAQKSILNLKEILDTITGINHSNKLNIIDMFKFMSLKDIDYISRLVATGDSELFFEGEWDFNISTI